MLLAAAVLNLNNIISPSSLFPLFLLLSFVSSSAQAWHGETCSTCQSWPPRGTSSTMRSINGGGMAWASSLTTCLDMVCWMLEEWWKWPRSGRRCRSVSTASPDPFRTPSESHFRFNYIFTIENANFNVVSSQSAVQRWRQYIAEHKDLTHHLVGSSNEEHLWWESHDNVILRLAVYV